jgi:predicted RNase H-like nuclease (RuvC/YqgF family)
MTSTKFDSDSLQSQISLLQKENEKSKDEVKEVLQALEELAMNYDQKLQEVDNRNKENDKLHDDLSSKQVRVKYLKLFHYLRTRKHFPCFYTVLETRLGV